ncbi:MAG: hypothetical protein GPJ52_03995 [Candidatus Heimdallarchaeota archaeon]|nr:hypothetical protein [Candidatus Heimdallarchaeota archaeon]MCG3253908.1 hypothetical protein [Candidatus Heimdallarchaeota archaeon]MCK4291041.1 hypothetical protein [Candidatus Heimdallarchaeota archaeon]
MKPEKKDKIIFIIALSLGSIILAGVILAIDFLYAGIQERYISNVITSYTPNLELAQKVILSSSLTICLGLIAYVLIVWYLTRTEKIRLQLEEEQIIDQDSSLNFRTFQTEISRSMKVLRDLFVYLIVVVLISGLFSFLRFVWILSKYRSSSDLFIEYYLTNIPSMVISVTLYLALGYMISYIVFTSLQKYMRLRVISLSYESAMEKVLDNFDRLMKEDQK